MLLACESTGVLYRSIRLVLGGMMLLLPSGMRDTCHKQVAGSLHPQRMISPLCITLQPVSWKISSHPESAIMLAQKQLIGCWRFRELDVQFWLVRVVYLGVVIDFQLLLEILLVALCILVLFAVLCGLLQLQFGVMICWLPRRGGQLCLDSVDWCSQE